jgi:hypothetical protein
VKGYKEPAKPDPAKAKTDAAKADPDADLLLSLPAGHVVFSEGDSGREMYIVESGEVEIVKRIYGRRQQRIALLEVGDFFGEMSVLEGRPRNATARCVTDARLLAIDAATFDKILRQYPEVTIRVLRSLSARLRAYEDAEQKAREVAAGVLAGARESPSVMTPVIASPAPPATPAPPAAALAGARLFHPESGKAFPLQPGEENILGRFDPSTGAQVNLDLNTVDPRRSLSRMHARILCRGSRYFLVEEIGTVNGTWVGSQRLQTGKEREIQHGDRLRLGRVDLVFQVRA